MTALGWKRLLFAFDFEAAAKSATDEVMALARRLGATVIVTHVQPSKWKSWISSEMEDQHRRDRLSLFAERFRSAGIPAEARLWTGVDVKRAVVELARLERADVIIVGASDPGHALGLTTAEAIVRNAEHPVWVSKPRVQLPGHILCGVEGSSSSRQALDLAARLRDATGARLTVLHAVGHPDISLLGLTAGQLEAERQAHRARRSAAIEELVVQSGIADAQVRCLWGEPGPTMLDFARDEDADLIVAGRSSTRGLRRLVLGSTAEYLLRDATCSTLLMGDLAPVPETG